MPNASGRAEVRMFEKKVLFPAAMDSTLLPTLPSEVILSNLNWFPTLPPSVRIPYVVAEPLAVMLFDSKVFSSELVCRNIPWLAVVVPWALMVLLVRVVLFSDEGRRVPYVLRGPLGCGESEGVVVDCSVGLAGVCRKAVLRRGSQVGAVFFGCCSPGIDGVVGDGVV